MRRRTHGSRSQRYESRLPSLAGWTLGVVACLGVLVALAYVHGNSPNTEDAFVSSVHETVQSPMVAAALAFAGLLMLAWCCRHLLLELLAWWPGRIIVEQFEAGPGIDAAQLPRLTGVFRDRLARSHLQSPAPVPAPAQHGDFLDVLSGGGLDPGNILGSLMGLLRVAVPTHAYAVKGALQTREEPRGCGVTVHVVLPGKGSPARTFWDTDWEGAIRRAADHATAAILPRTRLCSSPWSAWRSYRMPSDLLHAYESGAEFEKERRYDEALDRYYAALRQDPMNIALRLQIGFLQEKLALFLDALATYQSILEVAPARRRRRTRACRDRERVLLVAQYRRAILLAGQELPRQWRQLPDPSGPTRRDLQRQELREQLRPMLTKLFESARHSSTVQAITAPAYAGSETRPAARLRRLPPLRLIDRLLHRHGYEDPTGAPASEQVLAEPWPGDSEQKLWRLRELLALAALHELARLRSELGNLRLNAGSDSLSPVAIDLSGLWIQQHLRVVLAHLAPGSEDSWKPDPSSLEAGIRRVEGRGFKRWQEHYNAACVYSLPLLLDEPHRPPREEAGVLAALAVRHLEQATGHADSGYLASRRDWVLSDDPDLDGLRAETSFKRYEMNFFPSAEPTRRRPRDLHKWELSRYTLDLLSATAERWEDTWLRRGRQLERDVSLAELTRWCEVELETWKRVRKVAIHHRHWETRVKLIKQMHRWQPRHGFAALDVSFPCFDDMVGWAEEDEPATDMTALVESNRRLLSEVAGVLGGADSGDRCDSLIADLRASRSELARLDAPRRTVSHLDVARLCESHSALWNTLERCLSIPGESAERPLSDAIAAAQRIWERVRLSRGEASGPHKAAA